MVEHILDGQSIIAIIIRHGEPRAHGIEFFTPDAFPLQVGRITRQAGHEVQAHLHRPLSRCVASTQEVLIVQHGAIRVDFYTEAKTLLCSRELTTGDAVLLASGGHGLTVLDDAQILEVKQGPYMGDDEKVHFACPCP